MFSDLIPVNAYVLPTMGDYILNYVPNSKASRFEQAGHVPFAEDAEHFNRDLAALVAEVNM